MLLVVCCGLHNMSNVELLNLSLVDAKHLMLKGDLSAVELVEAFLENIEVSNKELNAFIEVTVDLALQQARESDLRIKAGSVGLIEGIPIAIKDLFCIRGIRTTAGAKMLDSFIPQYDSTVTALLRKNGGVCVGKTNLDAYGMGSTTHFTYYGPTINPWKSTLHKSKKLVPGGSSGGSAVAVAARMSIGALGTDTGGSVRQPAALCGVVGMKPTYGRCSRYGVIALASSLDQPGVFAGSVEDAAVLLEAISGYDPHDSTSTPIHVPHFAGIIGKSVKGMRVGIPSNITADLVSEDVMRTWEMGQQYLKEAGMELVQVNLDKMRYSLPVYYILMSAESSSNLERYDGVRYGYSPEKSVSTFAEMVKTARTDGLGEETKRRIMLGTYVLSASAYGAHYIQAQKVRRLIADDFISAFQSVDVILTPTTPSTAFAIEDKGDDTIALYMEDLATVPASLVGLPAMSVPIALSKCEGLPIGLQIIGKYYDEESVFKVGYMLEKGALFPKWKVQ